MSTGWQQTLEFLERGELSDSEIDTLPGGLMREMDDAIERVKGGEEEAADLVRVLGQVRRELDRVSKDRMWLRRPLRRRL